MLGRAFRDEGSGMWWKVPVGFALIIVAVFAIAEVGYRSDKYLHDLNESHSIKRADFYPAKCNGAEACMSYVDANGNESTPMPIHIQQSADTCAMYPFLESCQKAINASAPMKAIYVNMYCSGDRMQREYQRGFTEGMKAGLTQRDEIAKKKQKLLCDDTSFDAMVYKGRNHLCGCLETFTALDQRGSSLPEPWRGTWKVSCP